MKPEKSSILIVEDEPKMRRLLELQLAEEGFHARTAPNAETGLQILSKEPFDVIVTDFKLPGMSGLDFLQAVKRVDANLPVVIMTAYGTVESAVDAMKAGASDYVLKPFSLAELVLVIRKELASHQLRQENRDLREALGPSSREATKCRPYLRWSNVLRPRTRRCSSAAKAAWERT
jgi:DNA-binding NtrC family response regulator